MKIFLAGHLGLVGSAIFRSFKNFDHEIVVRGHNELDLSDQSLVNKFFEKEKFDQVYLAAAKVGGIHANSIYPAEFIYQNLMIQTNVIHAAHVNDIQKLLMLGSNCIYPKVCEQPIKENYLLTGRLEPTNESYAIAKIAGIKMCEAYNIQYNRDYRNLMPCNLYGPEDNFNINSGHVAPALIHKMHIAKINGDKFVEIWGSGLARREFLYSDDMADACIHIMNLEKNKWDAATSLRCNHINLGFGCDITLREFAAIVAKIVGFQGELLYNSSMPDGTMKKLLDNTVINSLGWKPKVELIDGIKLTYDWFLTNIENNSRKDIFA